MLWRVLIWGTVALAWVHDDETNLDLGGGLLTTSTDRALFVAKYDEAGTHLWSDTFAIDYAATFQDVAAAPDGHSAFAGEQVGYLDLGTGPLVEEVGVSADDEDAEHPELRERGF